MDLHLRIERLERQNRNLKIAVGACIVLCSAVCLLGANFNRANIVRANGFELVNDAGTVVAEWETVPNGVRVQLNDADGHEGLVLNALRDTGGGVFVKKNGDTKYQLMTDGLRGFN